MGCAKQKCLPKTTTLNFAAYTENILPVKPKAIRTGVEDRSN